MPNKTDDIEITPLHFLEAVYCNPNLPLNTRMRAAIEAAPYKHAKLSVAAIGHFEGKSFAEALERAIERSKQPAQLMLNGPVEELPASELKKLIGGTALPNAAAPSNAITIHCAIIFASSRL